MSHAVVSPGPGAVRLPGVDAAAWPDVRVVETTGSTNADLLGRARAGERGPAVLLARAQEAGRGRLGRSWDSPPGLSLSMSVLLAPAVPAHRWGWLPLLAGLAVRDALAGFGVVARLKWPNDVLAAEVDADVAADGRETPSPGEASYGGRKLAGVLVEGVAEPSGVGGGASPRAGTDAGTGSGRAVVGIGLNVDQTAADLPVRHATSLRLVLAPQQPPTPEQAATAVLDRLGAWLTTWRAGDGDPERAGLSRAYREACATLGRPVRIAARARDATQGPGPREPGAPEPGPREPGAPEPGAAPSVAGRAVDIAPDGGLVVEAPDGTRHSVVAGDVEHVR